MTRRQAAQAALDYWERTTPEQRKLTHDAHDRHFFRSSAAPDRPTPLAIAYAKERSRMVRCEMQVISPDGSAIPTETKVCQ